MRSFSQTVRDGMTVWQERLYNMSMLFMTRLKRVSSASSVRSPYVGILREKTRQRTEWLPVGNAIAINERDCVLSRDQLVSAALPFDVHCRKHVSVTKTGSCRFSQRCAVCYLRCRHSMLSRVCVAVCLSVCLSVTSVDSSNGGRRRLLLSALWVGEQCRI